MAIGKQTGEFSYKMTSLNIADDGSGGQVHTSTWDGETSGFGTVLGTLTLHAPGTNAQAGRVSWRAAAYLESGEVASGSAEGTWSSCGTHQWRIRSINLVSDGQVFGGDGVVDLASRSFKGTLFEWD